MASSGDVSFGSGRLEYVDNWKELKNFDTKILCEDGYCDAHRLVICYASPFMGSLLDDQFPGEITYYSIPDLSVEVMSLLLELAYTGRLTCRKSVLGKVEDAMKFLGWIKLECLEMQVVKVDISAPEDVGDKEMKMVSSSKDAENGSSAMPDSSTSLADSECALGGALRKTGDEIAGGVDETEVTAAAEEINVEKLEQSVEKEQMERQSPKKRKVNDQVEQAVEQSKSISPVREMTCDVISGEEVKSNIMGAEPTVLKVGPRVKKQLKKLDEQDSKTELRKSKRECVRSKENALSSGTSLDDHERVGINSESSESTGKNSEISCADGLDSSKGPGEKKARMILESHQAKQSPPDMVVTNKIHRTVPPVSKSKTRKLRKKYGIGPCRKSLRRALTTDEVVVLDVAEDPKTSQSTFGGDMNGVDGESSEGATSVAGAQEIKPAISSAADQPVNGEKNRNREKKSNNNMGPQNPKTRRKNKKAGGLPSSTDAPRRSSSRLTNGLTPEIPETSKGHDTNAVSPPSSHSPMKSANCKNIEPEEWKKITTCQLCNRTNMSVQNTTICLLSHRHIRCWTCLDPIPANTYPDHLVKIHKQKGRTNEEVVCKWCGSEETVGTLVHHVLTHSPGSISTS